MASPHAPVAAAYAVQQSDLLDHVGLSGGGRYRRAHCRLRLRPTRIEEVATRRLVEKFPTDGDHSVDGDRFSRASEDDQRPVSVRSGGDAVVLDTGGVSRELTRDQARELRAALGDALTERREFVRTVGTHRDDGAYVVERRGADSAGHRKVFDDFAECHRLYDRLPEEFTADDVRHVGVTGGRRHMLVWHFTEYDAFGFALVSRQPLTTRKGGE